jgi:putative hydrolase of the HAD superfamily
LNLPPQTKAVTFDVGGTLLEPFPSVGHIYAEAAVRHGFPKFPADLLKQRFISAWGQMENFNYTRTEWARLVDATFQGLIDKAPSETFFPKLYEQFALPGAWRVFPDVRPTLEKLASVGLKLAIISNWDERLRPLLRGFRLDQYFESIIISCEVGYRKPMGEIFRMTAEKLGLLPEEILHVGDHPTNDSEGARAAGLKARLLLRNAKRLEREQIQSLCELYS